MGNDDCNVPQCHFCGLNLPINFKLSGLCEGSIIDKEYALNIEEGGDTLEFIGVSGTDIKKNVDNNMWEIVDALDDTMVIARAVEKNKKGEYPLGTKEWISINDSCGKGTIELKISQCEKVSPEQMP